MIVGFAAVIIGVPVLAMRYARARDDRKCLRKLDQRVKNELLSREGGSVIGAEVMAMVKGHILRSHVITLLVAEVMFVGVSILGGGEALLAAALLPLTATAASVAVKLHGLADSSSLIKVKAFVFRTGRGSISAAYYDMQRLEYRVFTQGSLFEDIDSTVTVGRYVNLIVRLRPRGYRVVRILRF